MIEVLALICNTLWVAGLAALLAVLSLALHVDASSPGGVKGAWRRALRARAGARPQSETDSAPAKAAGHARRVWRPAPLDLTLYLLLLIALLSLAVTPSLARTLQAGWPLLLGLILCWLVARWAVTAPSLLDVWLLLALAAGGVCVLGVGGMQEKQRVLFPALRRTLGALLAWRDQLLGRRLDAFHPNVIAGTVVVLLPFCLAGALRLRRGRAGAREPRVLNVLALLVWLLGCTLVLLTQSRGAYLGLAAGLLVLVVCWPRSLAVLVPCAVVGIAALGAANGWDTLARLARPVNAAFGLGWRSVVWANGLRVLASYPFTGVGLGCFSLVTEALFPMSGAGSVDAAHAHNLYLQVGIDLGIPGLVAYLAALGLSMYLVVRAARLLRGQADPNLRLLASACLASLSGMCVHGLVDVPLWDNKSAFIPWIVLGLCAALYRFACAAPSDAARPE